MLAKTIKSWLITPFRSLWNVDTQESRQDIPCVIEEKVSLVRSIEQKLAVVDHKDPRVFRVYKGVCEQRVDGERNNVTPVHWNASSVRQTTLAYIAVFPSEEQRRQHQERLVFKKNQALIRESSVLSTVLET